MDQKERERLEKIVAQNEYMKYLGLELLDVDLGYAKARIPYSHKLLNPYGYLHGGVLFSLADIVAGLAACTYGGNSVTIDGNMNYARPAMNTKDIICEAREVRQGKHVAVYRVEILNDERLLLDTGTFTFFMM